MIHVALLFVVYITCRFKPYSEEWMRLGVYQALTLILVLLVVALLFLQQLVHLFPASLSAFSDPTPYGNRSSSVTQDSGFTKFTVVEE